jgi:diguanylate cyclase (GGDEF)-like protein
MRLIGRHDVVLVGGFGVAAFVVFSPSLEKLLDYVRDIDEARGLRMLPGLLILASVLVFQQLRKRQEIRTEAVGSAAVARMATERAAEMERLVTFGQALARSLDDSSIRNAATAHVPLLAPGRNAWVLVRHETEWEPLMTVGDGTAAARARAASHALGEADLLAGDDGDLTFPMIVAGTTIGMLGVSSQPALTDQQRSVLTAAAALLAVSLKNAELFRKVHENSVRDALTGCYNRTHALEVMTAELRRARRSLLPASLLMFDLDHFKLINDRYGHLCGDAVLAEVGARMKAVLRVSDMKCRYGGEEFVVMLPETPISGAMRAADNLRRELEANPIHWNGQLIHVTASVGATAVLPGEVDPLVVLARADAALYQAKEAGRNCVRVSGDAGPASVPVIAPLPVAVRG